jgi:IS30 family transposase
VPLFQKVQKFHTVILFVVIRFEIYFFAEQETVGHPQRAETRRIRRLSAETIYRYLYGKLKEVPELKRHFRHPYACRTARIGKGYMVEGMEKTACIAVVFGKHLSSVGIGPEP